MGPPRGRMMEDHIRGLPRFVQRSQATSTEVHTLYLAVDLHPHALNVRLELPVGRPFRVADIMSKLRTFATHFTLCHSITSH